MNKRNLLLTTILMCGLAVSSYADDDQQGSNGQGSNGQGSNSQGSNSQGSNSQGQTGQVADPLAAPELSPNMLGTGIAVLAGATLLLRGRKFAA